LRLLRSSTIKTGSCWKYALPLRPLLLLLLLLLWLPLLMLTESRLLLHSFLMHEQDGLVRVGPMALAGGVEVGNDTCRPASPPS